MKISFLKGKKEKVLFPMVIAAALFAAGPAIADDDPDDPDDPDGQVGNWVDCDASNPVVGREGNHVVVDGVKVVGPGCMILYADILYGNVQDEDSVGGTFTMKHTIVRGSRGDGDVQVKYKDSVNLEKIMLMGPGANIQLTENLIVDVRDNNVNGDIQVTKTVNLATVTGNWADGNIQCVDNGVDNGRLSASNNDAGGSVQCP